MAIYVEKPGIIQNRVSNVIQQGENELLQQYEENKQEKGSSNISAIRDDENTINMSQTKGITIMEEKPHTQNTRIRREPVPTKAKKDIENGEEISR